MKNDKQFPWKEFRKALTDIWRECREESPNGLSTKEIFLFPLFIFEMIMMGRFESKRSAKKRFLEYYKAARESPDFREKSVIHYRFQIDWRHVAMWRYIKAAKINRSSDHIVLCPISIPGEYEMFSEFPEISEICYDEEIFHDPVRYINNLKPQGRHTIIFVKSRSDKELWEQELRYQVMRTHEGPGFFATELVSQLENPHDVLLPC